MNIDITAIAGFETVNAVRAMYFTLNVAGASVSSADFNFYYRPVGSGWTLLGSITVPGSGSYNIAIAGLALDQYQLAVVVASSTPGNYSVNEVRIDNLRLDDSSPDGAFLISGFSDNAQRPVSFQTELTGLTEGDYDFRLWRTTVDHTEIAWQDDIYLRGYAEIVDATLSYPEHPLLGLRIKASERLSGGRPKVTEQITAAPLTVPASHIDAAVVTDHGIINTYLLVNNVVVTGMRKITINASLAAPDGLFYWLVRMDSSGYAQPDRLLTKYFSRVQTWTVGGGQSVLYIQESEPIPADTSLLLFHETADPYVSRHTAWAVARMLIDGSHGRITQNNIDWDAFAAWDTWNMETKDGAPRHLFDAVIDFSADLWSIAIKAAQTARGNLLRRGNKYSVWVDKATTHRQVFGEGNSNNVSFSPIPRADRANILTTSFLDAAANYEQKDISREDVQGAEYPIVRNVPVQVGVTRESQATALLDYMLLQNRYVGSTVSFDAGMDAIEVTTGDVFICASQAKDFSLSGRLVTVIPGVSVALDQPFTPEAGISYQLTVWGTDGTLFVWTGTLAGSALTSLPCPEGLPANHYYEYPYVLSKLTQERMKFRCIGVKRQADTMNATLTGIEYRDEVYAND
jgi:hypothetical protein